MPGIVNPLLLDFPDQIETERLIVRAPRPGDGAQAHIAIAESLEELRPWMPWAQVAPTQDQSEAVYRTAISEWHARTNLMMVIIRKGDGLFVGGTGLHRIDWTVPRFEIGYWVRTSQQGQGYITEAVNGLTDFALHILGAKRIEIRCDARNTRSAAVAQRAGYTLEARLHHDSRGIDGSLRDTLIFVKFPAEG